MISETQPLKEQEILRRLLMGHTCRRVAKSMGIAPVTVYKTKKRERSKDYLRDMSAKVDNAFVEKLSSPTDSISDRIRQLSSKALDVMEETINNHVPMNEVNPRDVLKTCGDILGMAGYGKPTTNVSQTVVNNIDLKDVTTALNDLKSSRK